MRIIPLFLAASVLLIPYAAHAATQSIPEAQARGDSGTIPTINLALNSGLPIKMPSGYRVYKGWLDNDTLAEVDGDRPFDQGASIIYLVARTRGTAKLSLMVRDSNGTDHLFVLRLKTGTKNTPDLVSIRGVGSGLAPRVETAQGSDRPSELIQAGLRRSGLLEGSELYQAVERFSALVDSGVPADSASQQLGLDLAVIRKLIRIGQQPKLEEAKALPVPQAPRVAIAASLPTPPPVLGIITPPPKPDSVTVIASLPESTPEVKPKKIKVKKPKTPKPDRVFLLMSSMLQPEAQAEVKAIAPTPKAKPKALTNHQRANRLVLGLLKAPKKDYVRGQVAITLLRRNAPLSIAAKKSGLPLKTLEIYINKGGQRNAPKI